MRPAKRLPKTRSIPLTGLALGLAAGALLGTQAAQTAIQNHIAASRAAATSSTALTAAEASIQAESTGQPVIAGALTTATNQTMANPNGTFTLNTSSTPVRVRKNGAWVALDATLIQNSDGTYSPVATTGSLVLSPGGSGPLAVLTLGGRQLSFTLPTTLPAPTVSGATATYSNVLPDTDLVVTATPQGGYSDVFVVKTAAAAANPSLRTLMKADVTTSGLNLATDAVGNFTATDSGGTAVFAAPAATAWDSTTAAATSSAASSSAVSARAVAAGAATPTPSPTGGGVDPATGAPLTSSVNGPGEHAQTASLSASYAAGTLTLNPPSSLLTGTATNFPIYIDPAVGPTVSAWTMVNSAFPTQSYYGVGTAARMQVGFNGWQAPYFTARSFTTLNLSALPAGAVVSSSPNNAEVNFFEDVAPSCTASEVDLYQTEAIYPGPNPAATTWSNQPKWDGLIGTANVAHGYSGCASAGVGFDMSQVVSTVVAGGGRSITLGLRVPSGDEGTSASGFNSGGNAMSWKQFNGNVTGETKTNASITYDVPPNPPSGLRTNPTTTCNGSPVGDTGMSLYANVSSPVGSNLTTTFNLYKTTDGSKTNLLTAANNIPSDQYKGPSSQPAVFTLPESFFKTLANGAATSFTWWAQTSDGTLASKWSSTCTFVWDPTRPGAPGVIPTTSPPTGTVDCALVPTSPTQPIGSPCRFTFTPPQGASISAYVYQVNDSAPITVTATGSKDVTVAMPSIVNDLTVSALSAGGNAGSSATVWFDGTTLNPPAADGDVNNDGTPDLVVPGQPGSAFPPGLWLANGHADGTTTTAAVNVGTAGLWSTIPTATSPDEWNGAKAITGNFCGNGAQDVLAYFAGNYDASANPHGGGGAIVCSNANSAPLDVTNPIQGGSQYTISPASIVDPAGNSASQVANAGNTTGAGTGNPDLLATIGNQLYLFAAGSTGGYYDDHDTGPSCVQFCDDLSAQNTPDGTQDWNLWTIASAQDTRNGTPTTDLYLWKPSTGDLYLWTGLTANSSQTNSFPNATTLSHTEFQIAVNWNTGSTLTLRAADINRDGIPDLWATDPSTSITSAYLLPALANSTQWPNSATAALNTSDHSWLFQDINTNTSGSTLAGSADSVGSLDLTGNSDTVWNTGDLYSPDALLNTNADGSVKSGGTGALNASGPAVTVSSDFTVSMRARPNALGGVILSQDGNHSSGFTLYPDGTGKWFFCLAKTDNTTWNYDCASGSTVQLGLWSQVTATYNHSTGIMTLYVNGVDVGVASHTAVSGFTGHFHVGEYLDNNTLSAPYSGQVTDIQAWNGVVPPAQPQSAGSDLVTVTPTRILDTRNGTGGTTGPVGPNAVVPLQITGKAGVPASGVTAVALSLTDTAGTGAGHLTVYPDGTPQPNTSAVNFPPSSAVTNSVIMPVGATGKIDILNSLNTGTGSSQIIADITGYFTTNTGATGASTYQAVTPVRALDTRTGTGAPKAQVGAGRSIAVTVAGTNDIPSTGVTAVAINLTAANEVAGGPLIAYPDGIATPTTTTVSFAAGQPTAGMSIVPLSNTGKFDIYNASGGAIDAIGDIVGYYTTATTGQKYHPLDATRLLDTRMLSTGPIGPSTATPFQQTAVSAVNPSLVVNITATQETVGGVLTVVPGKAATYTQPPTSTLNYATDSIANLDLALTSNDYYTVFNNTGTTHLIIDTNGYFASY